MNTISYVRVSSKEQAEEGYSIESQQKFLREYAIKNNLEIVKEFVEVESAKQIGRKAFSEMVAYLKHNSSVKTVLCEKTDRLYRNFTDYVILDPDQMDITLIFAKEGEIISKDSRSHQKLVHGLKVLLAKNYIDNLREESTKGLLEKAEQGEFPQGAPIGYKNNKETKKIEVDIEKAPIVRRLFELYASGNHSLAGLRDAVVGEGLISKTDRTLYKSRNEAILKNPIYYGYFRWRGQLYKGIHEPIISKMLFDSVQMQLKRRGNRVKQTKRNFMYSGLLTCAKCGCSVTAEIKKGKYIYYHCTWSKGKCGNGYIGEPEVERQLGEAIKQITISDKRLNWFKKALLESHEDEKKYHTKTVDNLNKEYGQLQDWIDKAYQDRLKGVIDSAYWLKLSNEWRTRQTAIQEHLNRCQSASKNYLDTGFRILELASKAYDLFKVREPHEKRQLLNYVLSNCTLNEKKLYPAYKKPLAILAKGSSSLNWLPGQDSNLQPFGYKGP